MDRNSTRYVVRHTTTTARTPSCIVVVLNPLWVNLNFVFFCINFSRQDGAVQPGMTKKPPSGMVMNQQHDEIIKFIHDSWSRVSIALLYIVLYPPILLKLFDNIMRPSLQI